MNDSTGSPSIGYASSSSGPSDHFLEGRVAEAMARGELPVDDEHRLDDASLADDLHERVLQFFGARRAVRVDVSDEGDIAGSSRTPDAREQRPGRRAAPSRLEPVCAPRRPSSRCRRTAVRACATHGAAHEPIHREAHGRARDQPRGASAHDRIEERVLLVVEHDADVERRCGLRGRRLRVESAELSYAAKRRGPGQHAANRSLESIRKAVRNSPPPRVQRLFPEITMRTARATQRRRRNVEVF